MRKAITKEDMALLKEASEMFNETGCVPGIDGEQVPAERIVPDAKEYISEKFYNSCCSPEGAGQPNEHQNNARTVTAISVALHVQACDHLPLLTRIAGHSSAAMLQNTNLQDSGQETLIIARLRAALSREVLKGGGLEEESEDLV